MVISTCYGEVKEVLIQPGAHIHERERLFLIRSEGDKMETISMDARGLVESLEVQQGDKVIPGMVLAYIKIS
jgi:biotin carboxyl carrier protein